ncbi:MAG: 5'/3'-nucleotidase SurE [Candidatus Cloacimonadota bacterium]|nr:5'/3'-nucleotidase SurE [Candidatus Cloacimonadota bacterium]
MKHILLTNDDGFFSEGIQKLFEVLSPKHNVTIVAPDRERSAASHSLTLHNPLRLKKIRENEFAVDGTPTDCVNLATNVVIKNKIDLVISGINKGQNMGEDILYSGTVAAAIEAMNLGIPALAVSLAFSKNFDFTESAEIVEHLLENNILSILSEKTVLNINIPPLSLEEIKGIRVTKLGHRKYTDFIKERIDPRGNPYYWIGGEAPQWSRAGDTDFDAIHKGFVSITPITIDMTKYSCFDKVRNWIDKDINLK